MLFWLLYLAAVSLVFIYDLLGEKKYSIRIAFRDTATIHSFAFILAYFRVPVYDFRKNALIESEDYGRLIFGLLVILFLSISGYLLLKYLEKRG